MVVEGWPPTEELQKGKQHRDGKHSSIRNKCPEKRLPKGNQ
jgi:hypothetical protein